MICVSRDPSYGRLKDHLTASTGLRFHGKQDEELAQWIGQRLSDLRLRDCSPYVDVLARSETEMDVLIERFTIGETYFFRDPEQFAAIRDIIIPDILERKRLSGRLRIWSAGCASGAEPYSLAILMAQEFSGPIAGWDIEILATDLNRSCLTRAAEGKFRAWALRSTPEEVKRECFSKEGEIWIIHPRFKQWVSFRYMNLAGTDTAAADFDLILCRNVMIYFTPDAGLRLIEKLYKSLGDGGWLVVGAAEHSLDNFKAFRTVNAPGAVLYKKPAPAREVSKDAPKAEPMEVTPGLPVTPDVDGLRLLADRGDWRLAAEYGRKLLARDRLNPTVHFYQALILENLEIAGEAERSLRRAVYLDRNFALAHYHLGLRLKKDGQTIRAARSFRNVLKVLAAAPDHAIIPSGNGLTATGLRDLAGMHLENAGDHDRT